MKGFILAAGLGTRLASLNLNVPKVMVPIDGKPLLEYHLQLFRAQGIVDVGINLHHMADAVKYHFKDGKNFGVNLFYSFEPKLLGTSGAIKKVSDWIASDPVIIFYGDNLTGIKFAPLLDLHKKRQSKVTLALYESPEPWTGGVVETDSSDRVISIIEKPPRESCKSNTISSGIFVMEPEILDLIPQGFSDFGKDIFPLLLQQKISFYARKMNVYIQDIGTPDRLQKAQQDFKEGKVFV